MTTESISVPGEPLIRRVIEGDIDQVAAIEREVFADPWSRRSFAGLLATGDVVFLVATVAEAVIGYAIVLVAPPESELANLAVGKRGQRRGVGRRLLAAAMRHAEAMGCTDIWLEVRASNVAAISLYAEASFREVGRRGRYYSNPVEDAIVMRGDPARASLLDSSSAGGLNPGTGSQ